METARGVDFTYYSTIFFVWVTLSLVLRPLIKTLSAPKFRHPPGPLCLPIIGHMHLLSSSSLPQSLQTLARKYGPLMLIRLKGNDIMVVSNAKVAKEILKTQDAIFASKYILGFGLSKFNIYEGDSLINSEYGEYWRFMKKLCMTKLLAETQLELFNSLREEETLNLLKSLGKKSKTGESVDLREEISKLTNEIICKMVLGKRCGKNKDLPKLVRKCSKKIMECGAKLSFGEMFGPLNRFDMFGNGRKLVMAMEEYDKLVEQVFTEFEENNMKISGEEKDLADILLETYIDTNAQVKLSKNKIKCFFLDMILAGVETTSATIQWAIQEIMSNPMILKKLRDEIEAVVGSWRLVKESDLHNLSYLQAVVKETLRRHVPGPLLRRECMLDTVVNGYNIKQGTKVIVNAYAIMNDPEMFQEADKFVPERFLIEDGDVNVYGRELNFIPFGSGRRACMGTSHAMLVTEATIASLIQCFDFKFEDEERVDIEVGNGYSGAVRLPLVCQPITQFDPFN